MCYTTVAKLKEEYGSLQIRAATVMGKTFNIFSHKVFKNPAFFLRNITFKFYIFCANNEINIK